MWSLGCILGEMLLNRPLFPGSSTLNQIERILDILPHPTREDMNSIRSELGERVLEKVDVGYVSALMCFLASHLVSLLMYCLVFCF